MSNNDNVIVRWLHNKAVADGDKWMESIPRHLLGSLTSADSALMASTCVIQNWCKKIPTIERLYWVPGISLFDTVTEWIYSDRDRVSNNWETNRLASVEFSFWVWYMDGRKVDAREFVTGTQTDRDEFFRLVHIIENPELVPYLEIGMTDEPTIRSFIANGIDVDMALSLSI